MARVRTPLYADVRHILVGDDEAAMQDLSDMFPVWVNRWQLGSTANYIYCAIVEENLPALLSAIKLLSGGPMRRSAKCASFHLPYIFVIQHIGDETIRSKAVRWCSKHLVLNEGMLDALAATVGRIQHNPNARGSRATIKFITTLPVFDETPIPPRHKYRLTTAEFSNDPIIGPIIRNIPQREWRPRHADVYNSKYRGAMRALLVLAKAE